MAQDVHMPATGVNNSSIIISKEYCNERGTDDLSLLWNRLQLGFTGGR
jgi:hypothetical protein